MRLIYRGDRAELQRLLQRIPLLLSQRVTDPYRLAQSLQLRCGVALLSQVQQDFLRKSRGQTGRDGIRWAPLKPATVAQRRITAAEKRAAGLGRGNRFRGLLNAGQDRQWRRIFASRLARLRLTLPEDQAKATAARIAWAVLKAQGAPTRLGLFGHRRVDILRDTGELFRSLSPGIEDRPSRAPGQIFQVTPQGVLVGTNKKVWHHRGIPGRLPARPLWPLDGRIPPAWWPAIYEAAQRGLLRLIVLLVERGIRI